MIFDNLMVDLETKGTLPGCAIVSISAIPFSFKEGVMSDNVFDKFVDIASCAKHSLYIDPRTEKEFWGTLPESTKLFYQMQKKENIGKVLRSFVKYLKDEFKDQKDYKVWSFGGSFDTPILATAYDKVFRYTPLRKLKPTWKYNKVLCTRTLKELAPQVYSKGYMEVDLPPHIGLNDCKMQIAGSLAIYNHFEGKLPF